MNAFDYMYREFSKSVHQELKKQIKGSIYVDCVREKNTLDVTIENGDLGFFYQLKDLDILLSKENSRTVAKMIVDKFKESINNQFFKEVKNGR